MKNVGGLWHDVVRTFDCMTIWQRRTSRKLHHPSSILTLLPTLFDFTVSRGLLGKDWIDRRDFLSMTLTYTDNFSSLPMQKWIFKFTRIVLLHNYCYYIQDYSYTFIYLHFHDFLINTCLLYATVTIFIINYNTRPYFNTHIFINSQILYACVSIGNKYQKLTDKK